MSFRLGPWLDCGAKEKGTFPAGKAGFLLFQTELLQRELFTFGTIRYSLCQTLLEKKTWYFPFKLTYRTPHFHDLFSPTYLPIASPSSGQPSREAAPLASLREPTVARQPRPGRLLFKLQRGSGGWRRQINPGGRPSQYAHKGSEHH